MPLGQHSAVAQKLQLLTIGPPKEGQRLPLSQRGNRVVAIGERVPAAVKLTSQHS